MTNHATIAHIGPHMKDSKSIANSNWLACAYHMGHMLMTMVFAEQYIQTINQIYAHIYYMHIDMYTYIYIHIYIYIYIYTVTAYSLGCNFNCITKSPLSANVRSFTFLIKHYSGLVVSIWIIPQIALDMSQHHMHSVQTKKWSGSSWILYTHPLSMNQVGNDVKE